MNDRYLLSPCCNSAIDLQGCFDGDSVACQACTRSYEVREDVDFAEFSTNASEYYKWSADNDFIVRYYFENRTLECLDGVAEHIKALHVRERRPHVLLPVFKAIHDCLKKRLQDYLVGRAGLSADMKARIANDLPLPGFNIRKLTEVLCDAYPSYAVTIRTFIDRDELKMLVWIRNKDEHLATASWPQGSYVHTQPQKMPSDAHGHAAELSVPLAVDLLNYCIDFLKLIYDVDPKKIDEWQYERLDSYRIHHTV